MTKDGLILSINGQQASYENLFKTFARSKPGDLVFIDVLRNRETLKLKLISGDQN